MINTIKEGITKNIIPLLLCISIITSCMYVYSKEYILAFLAVTSIAQIMIFTFYTYLSKKTMILRFISVIGSFLAICGLTVIAVRSGHDGNSIDFFVWFLSPQALVKFSLSYIIAIFIIINFFIASTVFYFSVVRYRISITFMIILIPFAFYRKEGEAVPVFFAFLLLILYVALMIHCRQLNTKSNEKLYIDSGYRRSITYFLAFSALLALALPKPNFNVRNDWVEYWLESDALTQYMLGKLGIVSDTSSVPSTYTEASEVDLFYFTSDEEPINLKSQTYSLYDYEKSLWHTVDSDVSGFDSENDNEKTNLDFSQSDAELLDPANFYKAVAEACRLDESFAEKYSLTELDEELDENYKRELQCRNASVGTKYFLAPTRAYSVKTQGADVFVADNGMLYSSYVSQRPYRVDFYSAEAADDENYKKLLSTLNSENYEEFLNEVCQILQDNNADINEQTSVEAYIKDYEKAYEYYYDFRMELPRGITNLSNKITRKYTSDIDKAYALQDYFRLNDFKYDLTYKRPDNYDMEYFLFSGKVGICSDYASAMVLMARSQGIPARYAEGVHLHNSSDENVITVTDSDLHAFPELFISGYGWMTFEPTQIDMAESDDSFNYKLMILVMIITFYVIALIIVIVRYVYPYLSEKVFIIKVKKSAPEKSVSLIINKITKIAQLDRSNTISEISANIRSKYGIDTGNMISIFNDGIYGGKIIPSEDIAAIYDIYKSTKERIRELKKISK